MIQNFKFDLQRFAFSGGSGTEADPYQISSLADLEQLRRDVNGGNTYGGKYLKVTKDIALSDNWTPIGTVASMFNGNFDGDGHTISGLRVYHTDHQLCDGFFGFVKGATIKNVHLTNVNIRSEYDDIGALIAQADETQVINCSAQGKMNVGGFGVHAGGLFGRFFSGSIKNCAFLGTFNVFEPALEIGIIAAFSPRLEGNYYYGDYDGLNPNGATRIYNFNVPQGVTSDESVTFLGKSYIKKGDVNLNYLGETYKYNVTGDVTVTLKDNKLFANDTELGATFPLTLEGDGSENNPFLIKSEKNLRQLAAYVNSGNNCAGKNFKLTDDIKLTGNFIPIGNGSNVFSGTFDGNGHTIESLTTNGGSYQGLFGYTDGATIKNVNLTGVNVTGESEVGALVGTAANKTQIINCSASGNVKGSANVGGLVGDNHGTIKDSAYLGGSINGTNKGVITGKNGGTLTDNYYYGTLADGVNSNGATQVFRIIAPNGVTSSATITFNDTKYITAGNAAFTYNGNTYNYTVTEDLVISVEGNTLNFDKIETVKNFLSTLEGDGSENNPYLIKTEKQFNQLAAYVNYGNDCAGKNFKLANDIVLTSNFTPIGDSFNKFKGNFDGDGKTVSNLKISGDNYQGLFGYTDGATIKNVNLTGVNVTGKDNVGALVGTAAGKTQILNCSASGNIKGSANVGGLVGGNNGTIQKSTFLGGSIDGTTKGAIAGNNGGKLTDNYYFGTLADGVNANGAARIFNATVPDKVTSTSIVEISGKKYITAGDVTFNYNGRNYSHTVTDDVTVTLKGNKFFVNDTEYIANFPGYLEGDGSENNPYLIKTEKDLSGLATYVNGGNNCAGVNFKLAKDIALTSEWTPVGTKDNQFKGTFDGNGKIISNLTIDDNSQNYQGLFGNINNATIKNVKLTNVNVSGRYRVSSLVGTADNNSQILNCSASGNLKSNSICSYVGGVVGYINSGVTVDGCTFSGNLEGLKVPANFFLLGSHIGGIVGVNNVGAIVKNCAYLGGTIKSSDGGAIISIANGSKNFIDNYYYGKLDEGIKDSGATQIFKATLPKGVTSSALVTLNGTNYIKAGSVTLNYGGQNYSCNVNADLTVTLQDDKLFFGGEQSNDTAQGLKLYASDKGDTLTGGAGNDSLWGGAGKDTFIHNGGNDVIYGFGNGDSLKINGFDDIIATYNAADNNIKIPCGAGSVTLKDFTTNEFPINNDTWTLSGNTLSKGK